MDGKKGSLICDAWVQLLQKINYMPKLYFILFLNIKLLFYLLFFLKIYFFILGRLSYKKFEDLALYNLRSYIYNYTFSRFA